MASHEIRLNGPWEAVFSSPNGEASHRRIRLPVTWDQLLSDFAESCYATGSRCELSRRFHRPPISTPGETISIRISPSYLVGTVMLGGTQLGTLGTSEFTSDVTKSLRPFDEVTIHWELTTREFDRRESVPQVSIVITDAGSRGVRPPAEP